MNMTEDNEFYSHIVVDIGKTGVILLSKYEIELCKNDELYRHDIIVELDEKKLRLSKNKRV